MILGEPRPTRFDLNFSLMGFPVRVHPAFFILPLLLGAGFTGLAYQIGLNAGVILLVLAVVFFVSILVHELGHALAFRYYGYPCRIMLYWMGGLAIPDSGGAWSNHRSPTS